MNRSQRTITQYIWISAVSLFLVPATALAQDSLPSYEVVKLDDMIEATFPGIQFPSSDARGLNENGDLVGEARLNGAYMQGFVYTAEHGVTKLPIPAGWGSGAVRDVSDRDENGEIIIVGGGVPSIFVDIAIGEAALWRYSTVTGEVLETRLLGIPDGFDDSLAVAVSNNGTVAGFSSLTGIFTNWKYDVETGVLETFDFPTQITDMNNVGQVCGGTYRGDLFGNYEDLSEVSSPEFETPVWDDDGFVFAMWNRINDQGWLVGRAATGISDGAGHFIVAITRFADPIGWTAMEAVSHLSLAGSINDAGDFTSFHGALYLDEFGEQYPISSLVAPDGPSINTDQCEINNSLQIAASQAHAMLLTPIATDVFGDLDGDDVVAFNDLLILLAAWGPCGNGDCAADLDESGDVGFGDLLILLANWS